MNNILKIIKRDLKSLTTNFFLLIMAIGLCVLPALYAWLNIYSNWDPYGNSQNVKIAVASEDEGYTDSETGETFNAGDEVLDAVKENDSIGWVILDSADQAEEGVKSGEYYAAAVIDEDFSRNMYNGFMEGLERPTIIYYENEKKNSVATKITDTAVTTLKNSIDEMYVKIVVSTLFKEAGTQETETSGSGTDSDGTGVDGSSGSATEIIATITQRIDAANENIDSYKELLTSLTEANKQLTTSLEDADADVDSLGQSAGSASENLSGKSVSGVIDALNDAAANVDSDLNALQDAADKMTSAETSEEKKAAYDTAVSELKSAKSQLNSMISSLQSINANTTLLKNKINRLITKLQSQVDDIDTILDLMTDIDGDVNTVVEGLNTAGETITKKIDKVRDTYTSTILPAAEDVVDEIDAVIADGSSVLNSLSEDAQELRQIISGTTQSVSNANEVTSGIESALTNVQTELESLKDELNALTESEIIQKVIAFMNGDPDGYGEFLAEPVEIESKAVYKVDNYGSGVTPFYTTLALWIGCVFLLAIMKATPSTAGLVRPRLSELFFGRFGILFLLGQLQWAIIFVGNVFVLKVQCLDPARFYLTGAITSFTFMLLCYAITLAFADVGKAIVVVALVLQVAGSSGTYPIEVLPEFFQKVYVFFPFPYAINAMRETMFGYYGNSWAVYMAQLLSFALFALALGLVIRIPFINVKNFMQQRMKDTGLM